MDPLRARFAVFLVALHACSFARAEDTAGPLITRGPYLQAVLQTTAEVLWLTDGPSRGKIAWIDEAGGPVRSLTDSEPATSHRMMLGGLAPGATYLYRVYDEDRASSSEIYRFRTSPLPGRGTFRVAAIGDSGTGDEPQLAVAAVIREMKPNVFLHTGDLVYLGDLDGVVFEPYKDILSSSCFFPTAGNHDEELTWMGAFFPPNTAGTESLLYYSFDWGSAHFVALDTNDDFQDKAQLDWLIGDLERARAAAVPWIILFFHKPFITVGSKGLEASKIRTILLPILDRFEVDLVLNGHDHNYQRSHPVRGGVVHDAWQGAELVSPRGTIEVITGGGGQILYQEDLAADHRFTARFIAAYHALELEIGPTLLTARAISADRQVLDEFSIRKGVPRPELTLRRGDVDQSGELEITDAVLTLLHIFVGETLDCPGIAEAAADVDGSGPPADLTDVAALLGYLFLAGSPPAPPFPACAPVPGADDSWCTRSSCR